MTRILLFRSLPILLFGFISCSSPDKSANNGQNDSLDIIENQVVMEQPDTVLFWTVNTALKEKIRVYKDSIIISDPLSIINGINSIYSSPQLEFLKLSGDTVYTHIDSSFNFANDLGSFGASEYISTVVLNLTMLPGVNYVNLDFPVGSHATPGVFAKSSYADYQEKDEP